MNSKLQAVHYLIFGACVTVMTFRFVDKTKGSVLKEAPTLYVARDAAQ